MFCLTAAVAPGRDIPPAAESVFTVMAEASTRLTSASSIAGDAASEPARSALSDRALAISSWRGYCSLPPATQTPIQAALPDLIASESPSPESATWKSPSALTATPFIVFVHDGVVEFLSA